MIINKIIKKITDAPRDIRLSLYMKDNKRVLDEVIKKRTGIKRIYLFCSPTHSNLGDQAQLMCWMRLFAL